MLPRGEKDRLQYPVSPGLQGLNTLQVGQIYMKPNEIGCYF